MGWPRDKANMTRCNTDHSTVACKLSLIDVVDQKGAGVSPNLKIVEVSSVESS